MTGEYVGSGPSRRDVLLSTAGVGMAAATFGSDLVRNTTQTADVETVDRAQVAADATDGNVLPVKRSGEVRAESEFHVLRFPRSGADTDDDGFEDVPWSAEDVQIDLYATWDSSGLNLLVEITDDVHRLPNREFAYAFDALRVAFGDPAAGRYGPEYLVSRDGEGAYLDQFYPGPDGFDTAPDVSVDVTTGQRRVSMTVPWDAIPGGQRTAGDTVLFGLATRDRDDSGTFSTLSWQDGPRTKYPRTTDVGLGRLRLLPADPSWTARFVPPREIDYTAALPKEVDADPDRIEVEPDDEAPFRLLAVNQGDGPVSLTARVPSADIDETREVPPDRALRVAFQPTPDESGDQTLSASVAGEDRTEDRSLPVRYVPPVEALNERFDRVTDRVTELSSLLDRCREAEIPVAEERLAAAVARNAVEVGRRDLQEGYHTRAGHVARTSERLADEAVDACQAYLDGEAVARTVPAYETGEVAVDGLGFTATTEGGDRREMVFRGLGAFFKAVDDVPLFAEMGLNQLTTGPRPRNLLTEPPADADRLVDVDRDALDENTEEALGRSAEHDLAVEWNLSLHDLPRWAEERYDIAVPNPGLMDYNPFDPTAKELLREYVPVAAEQASAYDSVLTVNLTVEAAYSHPNSAVTADQWAAYLAETHGDVGTLNDRYATDYDAFSDVPTVGPFFLTDDPAPRYYDWAVFNSERFGDWHAEMAQLVRDAGVDAPVEGALLGAIFRRRGRSLVQGAEPERVSEGFDIWNIDEYNYPARYAESSAAGYCDQFMEYDLLTSLSADPIVEHATHLYPNDEGTYYPLVADHVRLASWQAAIHGVSAMAPWVWHAAWRTNSWTAFADSLPHRPEVTAAYARSALDLRRLADEVAALRDQSPSIALLYSLPSQVYADRRHVGTYYAAIDEAYQAASLDGRRVGFVSERQARDGGLAAYDLVVVPHATHVAAGTLTALAEYASSDGRLLVVGDDSLRADEYDRPHDTEDRRTVMGAARIVSARATAEEIRPVVRDLHTRPGPDVVVRSVESNEPADNVEWRTVTTEGRQLVSIANYAHEERTFEIVVDGEVPDRLGELVEGRQIDGGRVTLAGLTPALVEIGGATGLRTEPRAPVTPTPSESPAPTVTDTPTSTATESPTPSQTSTEDPPSDAEETTSTEGPGFGIVTTVAAGLAAVRVLLRRRDDDS